MMLLRSPGRSRSRSKGQALVEFALIAPLLFLLIFGIIEAGRFILYYHTLNHAVREGARYAIVHGSNSSAPASQGNTSGVVTRVEEAAFDLMSGGNLTVNVCYYQGMDGCGTGIASNNRGDNVRVDATYTYSPIVNLIPSISISAEATLVINN